MHGNLLGDNVVHAESLQFVPGVLQLVTQSGEHEHRVLVTDERRGQLEHVVTRARLSDVLDLSTISTNQIHLAHDTHTHTHTRLTALCP